MKRTTKRRKRLIFGIPVLLLAAYVSSYFTVMWIEGRRFEPFKKKAYFPVKTVYAPILWYQGSSVPGGTECWALATWFHMNARVSYDELHEDVSEIKKSAGFRRMRERGEL
jgi:hypothetical protein